MTFSLFATHPYASQAGYDNSSTNYYTGQELCPASGGRTFCPAGQTITDMEVTEDGHLIAGYGDWNSNVDTFGVAAGRVGVVPLNLTDATWGSMFYAGAEALDVIRKIDGKLYIPTTDPSDRAATSNPHGNISGYITNETGEWSFVSDGNPNNIHAFDVTTLNGTDRYTAGSNTSATPGVGAGAVIKRSTDSGATWQESTRGPGGDFDRFYAMASLNGKLYAKASASGPAVSFDGSNWGEEPNYPCAVNSPKLVEVFDGRIVCRGASNYATSSVKTFDGQNQTDVTFTISAMANANVRDFYVEGQYLYILTVGGEIYRTDSLSDADAWRRVDSSVPSGANSIAVHDNYIYIGATNGQIFRSGAIVSEDMLVDPMVPPQAAEGATPAECFRSNLSAGKATITDYYDHESNNSVNPACPRDVVIPETIGGISVTSIGSSAFSNNQITELTIPSSVTSIGNYAFNNNQITELTIPSSVTSIGNSAFSNNQITELPAISDSITTIGSGVFSNNQITELTIPSSVTSIGNSAFSNNQITELTIPSSVTSIGSSAFSNNQITELTIPSSVTSIGNYAFNSNQITELPAISDSITTIGSGVFSNNQITELTIPSSVTSIGNYAFSNNQITELTIPSSVTSIGNSAFYNNQITELTIPNSVTSIGVSAFSNNQITELTIPSSVTSIGSSAFSNNQITELTILDSVTSIGSSAFSNNQITELTIPNSVTTIGYSAFSGNPLTNLSIDMVSIPSNVFSHGNIESLHIGDSVTTIGVSAFSSNQIAEITIPNSVTSIGISAFSSNQIAEITIPNSVTSIGISAFSGNPLTNLSIDMVSIPSNVFSYGNIESLHIGDSVTTIGNSALSGNQITELTIPDSVTSIGNSAFRSNQITELTIPDSVTTIGNSAFRDNQITELTIPNSVTSIGNSAFYNNQITELTIPDSVTTIEDGAFALNNIEKVYIKGETELGEGVFSSGNSNLFSECIGAINPPPSDLSEYIPCYESSFAPSDSVKLIQLYADYPGYYEDELYIETTFSAILDTEPAVIGGYIVNPASATTNYNSQNGTELHEPNTKVGEDLSSYSLKALFDAYPDVTADDLADIYYRQGDEVTINPLQISGYSTPQPITATLASGDNNFNFVYVALSNGGDANSPEEGNRGESVGAPNTGIETILKSKIGVAIGLIILALAVTGTLLYRKRAQRH